MEDLPSTKHSVSMTTTTDSVDMAQFFDFGEDTGPSFGNEPRSGIPANPRKQLGLPTPDAEETTENSFIYLNGTADAQTSLAAASTDFNTDFSSWLPRYKKPTHPCEYCRSRSLECFIYNSGGDEKGGCSPCNVLFRPCSFSEPEKMAIQASATYLDTLDVVAEDAERSFGGQTGKKPLRSLGYRGEIEPDNESGPKKGAAAARFPRAAIQVLKQWLAAHVDNPYPTEDEKEVLKDETGLSVGQISTWMANTRRRQKTRPKRSASPSIRPSTRAINIPAGRTWDDLNPLERWKHSPPENEPAPLNAIAKAVKTFDPPQTSSLSSSYNDRKGNSNGSTGSFSVFRAPSTTSLETGFTKLSSGSMRSKDTAWSNGSRHSLGSFNSFNSRDRRRRRRVSTRITKPDDAHATRMFQCTFCTDTFKSKYDWSRHEKSLHLSLEKWICAPLGEVVICSATGKRKCTYCNALEPSKEHLAEHNHSACEEKGLEARTFYRKDHLRQHLRLMHDCKMIASMESWKSEVQAIKSRCGFCGMEFQKWQDRTDHLAKEFRNGALIKNWKGCRGLDAHVAIQVTNAMPPYLIGNESKSPMPFSASKSATMKHNNLCLRPSDLEALLPNQTDTFGIGNYSNRSDMEHIASSSGPVETSNMTTMHTPHLRATCWEILTLHLGQYARQYYEKHGTTANDDELQTEARRILYDSDDPWNQTAADNSEWLALFKQAHGIPDSFQQSSGNTIAAHEVLEDLGLAADARLDESFNLKDFGPANQRKSISSTDGLSFGHSFMQTRDTSTSGSVVVTADSFSMPSLTSATASAMPNMPMELAFDALEFTNLPTDPQFTSMNPSVKAANPLLTPLDESDPFSSQIDLTNYIRAPGDINIAATGENMAGILPTSTGVDFIQGGSGLSQDTRWDESELGFGMDIDWDLDLSGNTGLGGL